MTPQELRELAASHGGASQALECAANRIEHLDAVLRQLIAATELHHLNPLDLENLSRYNQAKCNAKQAIGLDI